MDDISVIDEFIAKEREFFAKIGFKAGVAIGFFGGAATFMHALHIAHQLHLI